MKAVILAGGIGKRLRPLTNDRPKPLVEVAGRPILEWQLIWLKGHGIKEIILCTGYMHETIRGFLGSGAKFGVKVAYSVEDEPLGTGGALKNGENILSREEKFLMVNGDILTNLDPAPLCQRLSGGYIGVIATVPLRSTFGVVEFRDDFSVSGFREKPTLDAYWINAGVYCLSSEILRYLPEKGDIESTAFPQLVQESRIGALRYRGVMWRSIDSHKDIEEAGLELPSIFSKQLPP